MGSSRWTNWRPGKLVRGTAVFTGWTLYRSAVQAASLVLMVKLFGAGDYGALTGAVALYTLAGQLVGIGSGITIVRRAVRGHNSPEAITWSAQRIFLGSSLLALAIALPASLALLPASIPARLLAILAVSEIVLAPQILPTVFRMQAAERMNAFGALLCLHPSLRLGALLALTLARDPRLEAYATVYLFAVLATASIFVARTFLRSRGKGTTVPAGTMVREGIPVAFSAVIYTGAADVDKTILLNTLGSVATGIYAAPFRVMQSLAAPIASLALAAAPRLFRSASTHHGHSQISLLVAVAAGYGVCAAALLYGAAPFLPLLMGSQFEPSVEILRWMSVYFILNCVRQVLASALTTMDAQWSRNITEAFSLAASLTTIALLAPRMGIAGAVLGISLGELLFVVAALAIVRRFRRALPSTIAPAVDTSDG
jgi:O-antigen/teichoic acid export membrane protein